jgi:hypothetical protein
MSTALNDGHIMLDLTIHNMMELVSKSCIRSNNTCSKINVNLQRKWGNEGRPGEDGDKLIGVGRE